MRHRFRRAQNETDQRHPAATKSIARAAHRGRAGDLRGAGDSEGDRDAVMAIDLFCGLGGWAEGLMAEGWDVIGFDIERHVYGEHRYPAQLALQDVRTIHGRQFKDAGLIVASPPCQEFSYMAMPWKRAKQIARALRGEDEFPENHRGSRTIKELTALFDACLRIQREASIAAGHHIPMVVENVRGAQPWVARARWHHGSFYLWGDVPALMPITWTGRRPTKNTGGSWFRMKDGKLMKPNNARDASAGTPRLTNPAEHGGKQQGICNLASKSPARKFASAMIAKIPFALSKHIGKVFSRGGL